MSIQQFLFYVAVAIVLWASFTAYRAKNRIYCTFTRLDKSTGHKWAKAKNGERIEWENGWYYVDMDCVTTENMDSGINVIIPTMVRRLYFRAKVKNPINPKTGRDDWETPQSRKNLNKREDIEALELGSQKALKAGKSQGFFGGGIMPIILIGVIVIIGYFVFQMRGQIDQLGNAINVLQSMMVKKFGG